MDPKEMDAMCKKLGPLSDRIDLLVIENADLRTMLESACLCSIRGMPFSQWPAQIRDWMDALRAKQRGGDPVIGGRK